MRSEASFGQTAERSAEARIRTAHADEVPTRSFRVRGNSRSSVLGRTRTRALFALLILFSGSVHAAEPGDNRAAEADMFGSPAESATALGVSASAETPRTPASGVQELAPENPLSIGGQFYLRQSVTAGTHQPPDAWTNSVPILADGWFDARPNDRVRGMLRARMSFDPTVTSTTSFLGASPGGGPTVALDQAWVNFDLGRSVFVTAGRQHVTWGSARFWNPNDLLHSARRDVLAQFDARVGQTMLKVHIPWEKRGWNLYAMELFESLDHAGTIGRIGGAARAEAVFGTGEFGIDAIAQRGYRPRAGADLSAGVGPIDVYAEGVIMKGTDHPRWREIANPIPGGGMLLESYIPDKLTPAVSGGLNWSFNITDKEAMTIGAEYFYQSAGYTKKVIYPWLIFQGGFSPFYLARDYAAAYAFSSIPGTNGNQSLSLSNIANLSDHTAIARLDWGAVLLTHLRIEAYVAGRYGAPGGEFRFGLKSGPRTINGIPIPALDIPAPVADAGLGLRVSF